MRIINNFIKLRELTAEDEYRKAKGLPPKEDDSPYDILEKYKDDPSIMISFKSSYYDKTKRLGLNLDVNKVSEVTPNAIYAYPLSIMWKNFDHKNRRIARIPFTGHSRNMSIVIMRLKGKGLNLQNYTEEQYKKDIEILKKNFPKKDISGLERAFYRENQLGFSIYAIIEDMFREYLEKKSIKNTQWTFVFTKLLGYDWVLDEGHGIIYSKEPSQCAIFKTSAVDLIDSIDTKNIFYTDSKEEISTKSKLKKLLNKLLPSKDDKSKNKIKAILLSNPELLWESDSEDIEEESYMHNLIFKRRIDILTFIFSNPKFTSQVKKLEDILNEESPNKIKATLTMLVYYKENDVIELLLDKISFNINMQDIRGTSLLSQAISSKNNDILELLLKNPNINVNIIDKYQSRTPLHIASYANNSIFVSILLKRRDIDVNIQDDEGRTPLHVACSNANRKIVELLLARPEIDVNIQNEYGYTSLHYACKENYTEIVELLLEHPKIDVNIKNKYDESSLDIAKKVHDNFKLKYLLTQHGAT